MSDKPTTPTPPGTHWELRDGWWTVVNDHEPRAAIKPERGRTTALPRHPRERGEQ